MPSTKQNTKPTPEEIRFALLRSAKKLFLEHGIAGTEMKTIAADAGLSRSTLYRYMLDRSQLAFMVSTEVLVELTDKCLSVTIGSALNGYEKLFQYVRHFVQTLCENVPLVYFLNEFDSIFRDEYPNIPEAQEYSETMNRMLHRTAQFLFEGLSDGSIKPIKSPLFFTSMLTNTIFGLAERLLPREAHYMNEHGASGKEIITAAVEILLESIKADG